MTIVIPNKERITVINPKLIKDYDGFGWTFTNGYAKNYIVLKSGNRGEE